MLSNFSIECFFFFKHLPHCCPSANRKQLILVDNILNHYPKAIGAHWYDRRPFGPFSQFHYNLMGIWHALNHSEILVIELVTDFPAMWTQLLLYDLLKENVKL